MAKTDQPIDLHDVYCASYLVLNGLSPEVVFQKNDHAVFRFECTKKAFELITEYSAQNPQIPACDFANAIRGVRSQLIFAKKLARESSELKVSSKT